MKNLRRTPWVETHSLGQEDPLEKEMTLHSSILAWKISWTEEPGRLYNLWGCKEMDMTEHQINAYLYNCSSFPPVDADFHLSVDTTKTLAFSAHQSCIKKKRRQSLEEIERWL